MFEIKEPVNYAIGMNGRVS